MHLFAVVTLACLALPTTLVYVPSPAWAKIKFLHLVIVLLMAFGNLAYVRILLLRR